MIKIYRRINIYICVCVCVCVYVLDELNRNSGRPDVASFNCINKVECPLCGRCNLKNGVHQACISPMEHNNDGERFYIVISAGNWKQKLYNHKHSFSNPRLRNETLRIRSTPPQIKWKIVSQSSTANSFNGSCNFCIDDKISIINLKDRRQLLNERKELVFKCRQKKKKLNYPDWGPSRLLL